MSGDKMKDATRTLARRIHPPPIERQNTTIRASFDQGGTVKPSALRQSLPPLQVVWYLSGAITNGTNVNAEIPLGRDARLLSITAMAKGAPSGDAMVIRLAASGAEVDRVSVQPGSHTGRSTVQRMDGNQSAGTVLTVDVMRAAGASNVTIIANYTVTG